MDLSRWMRPQSPGLPEAPAWIDNYKLDNLEERQRASRIRLERCLGPDDATEQLARLDMLGVYCLTLGQGQEIFGLEPWRSDSTPPEARGEMLVAVRLARDPDPQRPDFLQRPLTRRWIETRFGQTEAGSEIALVFPPGGDSSQGALAWTNDFPRLYAERWEGEEIRPHLPLLWFDGPRAERFRSRYRLLLAELFRANFLEPLAEWAEEQNRKLIGRFSNDETLIEQLLDGWGPAQRFLETIHTPALLDPGTSHASPLPFRQAISAARQFERAEVLNDAFDGREGRQTPLDDFRLHAERSLALGATRLTTHPAPASFRGVLKRSAGASALCHSQPWHPEWLTLSTELERLADIMRQGSRQVDILVLTPSESLMAAVQTPLPPNMTGLASGKDARVNEKARQLEQHFLRLLDNLKAFQIDFDLGDEDHIIRHGRPQANAFHIGPGGEYTVLIIPPALDWRAETFKKIRRFARKGGSVLFIRPLAPRIGGDPSDAIEELADTYANVDIIERAGREVCFQLNRLAPRPFVIRATGQDTSSLIVHHRRCESHEIFLVTNTSRQKSIEGQVRLAVPGAVRVLDPSGPRILLKDTDDEKGAHAFNFNFHAASTALFAVGGESLPTEILHQRRPHATSTEPLEDTWNFTRLDPNLLPLGECRVEIDGESFSPRQGHGARRMPVEFARVTLDERFSESPEPATISLAYEFDSLIEPHPERRLTLLLEPNAGMEVTFNRQGLDLKTEDESEDWKPDPDLLSIDVSELLRRGKNHLEIQFPFPAISSQGEPNVIETPILLGDFAVSIDDKGQGVLEEEPTVLRDGSWTDQGYPYYAGRIRYRQEFLLDIEPRKRYFLALHPFAAAPSDSQILPAAAGAAITARVGPHQPAILTYAPHRLEITRLARAEGEINTLEIEIASTLHNLYGPVHTNARLADNPRRAPEVHDALPTADRRLWNRKPNLIPFGLLGGAAIETYDPDVPPPDKLKKQSKKTNAELTE